MARTISIKQMFKLKQIKLLKSTLSNCYPIELSQQLSIGVDKYHPRYCSNNICDKINTIKYLNN